MFEDEIRNLSEAASRNRIIGCKLDISFSENITDVSRLRWHVLILAPVFDSGSGYPRLCDSAWSGERLLV